MLHVNGNQILDENDQDFQIKGVSLIDIGEIKEYIRGNIDTALRFWNINTIRLPIYPPSVHGRKSTYPFLPGNHLIENVLIPTIAYADAHDLQVIIDWHQINPLTDETVDGALEFWTEALPKIAEWDNIILEVYNEPTNGNATPPWNSTSDESWALCKPFLQTLVSGVRALSDKLIICPTPVCCRLPLGANNDPLDVDNVAYAAHIYPPDVWGNEGFETEGFIQDHINFSNAIIGEVRNSSAIPLVLTEVGLNVDNTDFTAEFESLLGDTSVGWIAWVLDQAWWPPLLNQFNVPSKFGKKVKQLMT